jgi:septum formation protein
MKKKIILASQSPYRRQLLSRLGLEFSSLSPSLDEEEWKNRLMQREASSQQISEFLAHAKAESIAEKNPDSYVIGSDQLLSLRERIYGKSHTYEKACEQLQELQGKEHLLLTSVAVFNPLTEGQQQRVFLWTVTARMRMKSLTTAQIQSYVEQDKPYDCAGSYKLEQRGIRLFESIECSDWTGIEGLPLLSLSQYL